MPSHPSMPPSRRASAEKAAYLHDLLGEMAELARRNGQPFLAYLIGMAAQEAARAARVR